MCERECVLGWGGDCFIFNLVKGFSGILLVSLLCVLNVFDIKNNGCLFICLTLGLCFEKMRILRETIRVRTVLQSWDKDSLFVTSTVP